MSARIPPGSNHTIGDNVIDRATVSDVTNDTQPIQPARGGPVSHDWSGVAVGGPPSGNDVEQAYAPAQPASVRPLGPGMQY